MEMKKKISVINNEKTLFLTTLKELKSAGTVIWSGNRMLDSSRIEELKNMYLQNSYEMIPGILHVFREHKKYHIYDGAHRYEAAIKSGLNLKALVSVLSNASKVYEDFTNVNKSVPVPEIYITKDKKPHPHKDICQKIVEYFNTNYPDFKSSSGKPRAPNYNQDILMETFLDIIEEVSLVDPNKNTLKNMIDAIQKANEETSEDLKLNSIKKCQQKNFYLFLDKEWKKRVIALLSMDLMIF